MHAVAARLKELALDSYAPNFVEMGSDRMKDFYDMTRDELAEVAEDVEMSPEDAQSWVEAMAGRERSASGSGAKPGRKNKRPPPGVVPRAVPPTPPLAPVADDGGSADVAFAQIYHAYVGQPFPVADGAAVPASVIGAKGQYDCPAALNKKVAAAAQGEYERLVAQAQQAALAGNPKAAVKLAKKAIENDPDRGEAYFVIGNAHKGARDFLRASECFFSATERIRPDTGDWAMGAVNAWDARKRAAPCGSLDVFCECERCAALPEKPECMRTPEALLAMAERVAAAWPEEPQAWRMHARAHEDTGDWSTAGKAYMKAAERSIA